MRVVALLVALTAVTAACGPEVDTGAPPTSTRPSPDPPVSQPLTTTTTEAVIGEVPPRLLEAVIADASSVSGGDEVEVVVAEARVWNDGSLGCPRPGELYTQAIVDGYRVVLSVGDQELDYRLTAEGPFRLCE